MNKRKHYTAEFKSKVVLEVLREESTVNEIASRYGIRPVIVSRWKKEFIERAPEIFKNGPDDTDQTMALSQAHIADLERKVGRLS